MTKKKTDNTNPNFEKSLNKLDDIVKKLETLDLSLEDSLEYFKKGVNLTKECEKHLTEAEQEVNILTKSEE